MAAAAAAAKELPRLFALFDTRQARPEIPGTAGSTERRYMFVIASKAGDLGPNSYRIVAPAVTLAERSASYNTPLKKVTTEVDQDHIGHCNFSANLGDTTSQHSWSYTGDLIFYLHTSVWVPVICISPNLPMEAARYFYQATGDTEKDCLQRINAYRYRQQAIERQLFGLENRSRGPAPVPSAPPAPIPSPIPAFVAEALVIVAKQKGAPCPITMTPFQGIHQVAITPCYHLFDASALTSWLLTKPTCPSCNGSLQSSSIVHHPPPSSP